MVRSRPVDRLRPAPGIPGQDRAVPDRLGAFFGMPPEVRATLGFRQASASVAQRQASIGTDEPGRLSDRAVEPAAPRGRYTGSTVAPVSDARLPAVPRTGPRNGPGSAHGRPAPASGQAAHHSFPPPPGAPPAAGAPPLAGRVLSAVVGRFAARAGPGTGRRRTAATSAAAPPRRPPAPRLPAAGR